MSAVVKDIITDNQENKMLVEYNLTDDAIKKLSKQFANANINDDDGYKHVKAAISTIVSYRSGIEKRRKELKADSLDWGRKIDAEAKRITALLVEIETPLKALKDEAEAEAKRKKEEAAKIERERIEIIRNKISGFNARNMILVGKDSEQLADIISDINSVVISEDEYQEFASQAEGVLAASKGILKKEYDDRVEFEAQQVKAAQEAAELKAQQDKIAAEKKKLKEEQASMDAKRAELDRQKAEIEKEAEPEKEGPIETPEIVNKAPGDTKPQSITSSKPALKQNFTQDDVNPDIEVLLAFSRQLPGMVQLPAAITTDNGQKLINAVEGMISRMQEYIVKKCGEL